METKLKKVILNIFPFIKPLRSVAFTILSKVNSIIFNIIEEVEVIDIILRDVTFRVQSSISKSVVFTVLTRGVYSVTFFIESIPDYTNAVTFSIMEEIEIDKSVVFYIIEGDDDYDNGKGGCIPLEC